MKQIISLALLVALLSGPVSAEIPVRDFARFEDYQRVRLSPKGDYVAVTKRLEDRNALAVIRLSDGAITAGLKFEKDDHIANFWWVGPDRIVVTLAIQHGELAAPQYTGELVGIDADGKRRKYLLGYRGGVRTGTRVESGNTFVNAWAAMVDPLPNDPEWALIKVTDWGGDREYHKLFRINVYTGKLQAEVDPPAEYISYYFTDNQGRVRYAGGNDAQFKWRSYARNLENGQWSRIEQGELAHYEIVPLGYAQEENAAYFLSNEIDGDRDCLVRQDLTSGKRGPLACDAVQSLSNVIYSADRSRPIAAVFEAGKPDIRITAPGTGEGKVLSALLKEFPGESLDDFSFSLDGGKLIFRAYSDRNPGEYFLFDRASNKLKRLFASRRWINPAQMAERRPLAYKARDGRTIHGYLTVPPGRKAERLPLVVNPHGGPFRVRDYWDWDAEPQLLAGRGYAVLQVNFRGSSGYGHAHYLIGKKNWGADMINDITDGVRHVIQQNVADPDRVCIYGASYGGYAALMSAVREPDLYRCVIAYAGVYDLARFKRDSDVAESTRGRYYLHDFVADTAEAVKAQSPMSFLDRLKAPVFIVHGEVDKRVPFSQAKLLRAALQEQSHPYDWLSKANEGHGFYVEDNRVEFYEKMLVFLDGNIGKKQSH